MSTEAGTIRAFTSDDAEAVAALFQSVMRKTSAPAPAALIAYLRSHFLDGPFADPEIPSLVYAGSGGDIEGFIGIVSQNFAFDGRQLRAAILGTLMVRDHEQSPMAGARLLKMATAGKQDVTLSETAGDASLAMWRQLRGDVLDRHSLDYIRVLKPLGFALDMLGKRISAAALLLPMASLFDKRAGRKTGPVRWTGLPPDFRLANGLALREADTTAFAALARDIWERDTIIPLWPEGALDHVISEAMDKPHLGSPHLYEVVTRTGKPVGGFLMHFGGKGIAHMTDVIFTPGQAGAVIDAAFIHARELGAAAVQGRTTPQLFDALLGRRVLFAHESASVIHTKDQAVLEAFQQGRVHFNGLVGERWTRLVGGTFV